MKATQKEPRPKKTSAVGSVERKPTAINNARKFPDPPASEKPLSTTAVITGKSCVAPDVFLSSGVNEVSTNPAIALTIPETTKTKLRYFLNEIPEIFAATGFPPTAVMRLPILVYLKMQKVKTVNNAIGYQVTGNSKNLISPSFMIQLS